MDERQERWQQEDEEREYMRRVALVRRAIESQAFSPADIEDLKYFLKVKEFFQ